MIKLGRIKEFVEKSFENYRNNKTTLKQLIFSLCSYADRNISYDRLWAIFEEEVSKHFNEQGEIADGSSR